LKRLEEGTFLACAVITHCSRHSCYIWKKKSIKSKMHGWHYWVALYTLYKFLGFQWWNKIQETTCSKWLMTLKLQ
jgi:hypothetical protein